MHVADAKDNFYEFQVRLLDRHNHLSNMHFCDHLLVHICNVTMGLRLGTITIT